MAEEGAVFSEQQGKADENDTPNPVVVKPKSEVFQITFDDQPNKPNLQEAFKKYRSKRQKEVKKSRKRKDVSNETRLRAMADPDNMWRLRMRFLDQARKYFGVPYAKRYWTEQDAEFHSPVFLDCCGLVRRCMRDLKKDFGFKIGPWNQAYMYDTLPKTITESEVKPGDLVFVSATYQSPKKKKQRHNMTHVEIMTGEGPQTIGSRWNKGKVQVFNSYSERIYRLRKRRRFKAESYHSEQYIFKSLDTWLMGICRSYCSEHRWRTRAETFKPHKHSIFNVPDPATQQQQDNKQNEQDDENASDSDSDSNPQLAVLKHLQRARITEAGGSSSVLGAKNNNAKTAAANQQDSSRFGPDDEENTDDCEAEDDDDDEESDEDEESDTEAPRAATTIGVATASSLRLPEKSSQVRDPSSSNAFCDMSNARSEVVLEEETAEKSNFKAVQTSDEESENLNNNNNLDNVGSKDEDEQVQLAWCNDDDEENADQNNNNNDGANNNSNQDGTGTDNNNDGGDNNKSSDKATEAPSGSDDKKPDSGASVNHPQEGQGAQKAQGRSSPVPWNDSTLTTPIDAIRRVEKKTSPTETARTRTSNLAAPKDVYFYIGGNNGVSLVEAPLLELGWKRMTNRYTDNFKLRWVECKSHVNFNSFKEGIQLVNRIPNCHLLTNKLGLLNSLQRFERVQLNINPSRSSKMCSADFLPETYRLDDQLDRKTFFAAYKDIKSKDFWICKPCSMNQGKGIYLVRDLQEFEKTVEERDESVKKSHRPMERIIQRYIMNPLLLDQRKFDIRAFMLIASTVPYLVLYHKGYVRLCLYPYDAEEHNLTAHLTNQFIQKQDRDYSKNKEETVWSMDKFNQYFNEHIAPGKGVDKDWVYNTLTPRMKQIMHYCFNAVKHKLRCRHGFFDLYGLDFMVDADLNVSLIEINVNPCLVTNCEALKEVLPQVVKEALLVAIECFEKTKRSQSLLPLQNLKNYQIIYAAANSPRLPRVQREYRQQEAATAAALVAEAAGAIAVAIIDICANSMGDRPPPPPQIQQFSVSPVRGGASPAPSQLSRPRSLSPLQSRSPSRPRSLSPSKDVVSSSTATYPPGCSFSHGHLTYSHAQATSQQQLTNIAQLHAQANSQPQLSAKQTHLPRISEAKKRQTQSPQREFLPLPPPPPPRAMSVIVPHSMNLTPASVGLESSSESSMGLEGDNNNKEVRFKMTHNEPNAEVTTSETYKPRTSSITIHQIQATEPTPVHPVVISNPFRMRKPTNSPSATLTRLNREATGPPSSKFLTASSAALSTSIPSTLRYSMNRSRTPVRAPSPIDKIQLALNSAKIQARRNERGS